MKQRINSLVTLGFLVALAGSATANDAQYGQGKTLPVGETVQAANFGNEITSSTRMPMYDAFRRFCLTTGAQAEAIEKAVIISGIQFHKRGPAATVDPMPMDTTAWDMDFEGHQLTINAGHTTEPHGSAMVQKSNTCTINSWHSNEEASVTALHKWAGISPSADQRRRGLTLYAFEVRGTIIVALEDDDAGRLAKAQGRTWHLMIQQSASGAAVMLTHNSLPFPRP
ncbi:MAG: hypothetical protein P4L57_14390 [Rhizomicrobium sp.]|nr:hypothetical protein [Rhizomicrobium sp.]